MGLWMCLIYSWTFSVCRTMTQCCYLFAGLLYRTVIQPNSLGLLTRCPTAEIFVLRNIYKQNTSALWYCRMVQSHLTMIVFQLSCLGQENCWLLLAPCKHLPVLRSGQSFWRDTAWVSVQTIAASLLGCADRERGIPALCGQRSFGWSR